MLRTTNSVYAIDVHHLIAINCATRVAAIALLLLVAGCQTTDPFAQWAQKKTQAENHTKLADVDSTAKSQVQSAKTADQQIQHVQKGQSEIAAWYRDGLQSHLQSAKMHFQEAVRTNPQNANAHHGLGIVADLEKDFATAEMHYQKALIYQPNDSRILGDLGYSYLLQNRLTESEQFLQRALQADPNNANAAKHLSDVQAKGDIELANMSYSQATQHQAVEQALYQQNLKPQSQAGSEVQLANHEAEEPSFFDRLMQREPEKDPTQEIREAMAREREKSLREREARERMKQLQDRANPYANLHPTRVRQQLQAIDQEAYQSAHNAPIMIDNQTGNLQRPTQTPWSGVAPNPQTHLEPQSRQQTSFPHDMQQQHQYIQQGQNSPEQEHAQAGFQDQARGTQSINSGYGVPAVNALYPDGQSRMAQQTPNRVPHTPTQHIRNQYYESNSSMQEQDAITQAQHAVPQGNPQTHSYRQGMASQANRFQQRPIQPADPYSQASRDAVRMGMGLSTTSPTTPRTSPGMGTHFNSPSFGQPQRILPTDLPPQDLSQAYKMQATEQAPPLNSQGQQLPSSAPPTMSQEQFATASRYNLTAPQQPQQQQPYYPSQQLQSYDQQRRIVDQTLNNTVQQAWGERQASSQLTPAGGPVAVERPADYAGMGQREIVQPAPWPHQSQPNSQQSYGYPETDRSPSQPQDQVVTPPPYNAQVSPRPSGSSSSYNNPATQRTPSRQYGQGQHNYRNEVSANGLPMIIPADR